MIGMRGGPHLPSSVTVGPGARVIAERIATGRVEDDVIVPTSPVISLVDDDASIRAATTGFLAAHGYAVQAFASALEFLRSPDAADTACLITDLQMPGMTGIELQDAMIAQGRRTPIVFISALPEDGIRRRALRSGAIGFLTKPFNGSALIECLNSALQGGGERPS